MKGLLWTFEIYLGSNRSRFLAHAEKLYGTSYFLNRQNHVKNVCGDVFFIQLAVLSENRKATFWRIKGREQVEWAKKEKLVTEAFLHIFVSFSCYLTKKNG